MTLMSTGSHSLLSHRKNTSQNEMPMSPSAFGAVVNQRPNCLSGAYRNYALPQSEDQRHRSVVDSSQLTSSPRSSGSSSSSASERQKTAAASSFLYNCCRRPSLSPSSSPPPSQSPATFPSSSPLGRISRSTAIPPPPLSSSSQSSIHGLREVVVSDVIAPPTLVVVNGSRPSVPLNVVDQHSTLSPRVKLADR